MQYKNIHRIEKKSRTKGLKNTHFPEQVKNSQGLQGFQGPVATMLNFI